MESRGNAEDYPAGGCDTIASTLHWGPDYSQNKYDLTTQGFKYSEGLDKEFHTYGLYWSEDRLYTYFDTEDNKILDVDLSQESFWERGQFPADMENPWVGEPNSAPFNKDFHLIFNVAVGGTNAYFPDGMGGKPWANTDPAAINAFFYNKN